MKKFIALVVLLCVMVICPVCNAQITNNEGELGFRTSIEYDKYKFLNNHNVKGRLSLYHEVIGERYENLFTKYYYRSNTNNYSMVFFAFLNGIKDTFEFDKSRKIIAHVGNQSFSLNKIDCRKDKKNQYVIYQASLSYMALNTIIGTLNSTSPIPIYFVIPVKNSNDMIYKVEREELDEWCTGLISYLEEVKRWEDSLDQRGLEYNEPYYR